MGPRSLVWHRADMPSCRGRRSWSCQDFSGGESGAGQSGGLDGLGAAAQRSAAAPPSCNLSISLMFILLNLLSCSGWSCRGCAIPSVTERAGLRPQHLGFRYGLANCLFHDICPNLHHSPLEKHTPLHLACGAAAEMRKEGHLTVIRHLLANGASANVEDEGGYTRTPFSDNFYTAFFDCR